MTDGRRPGLPRPGLRARLALWIAAILVVALGATFVAVHRGTGSELRARIDRELAQEVSGMAAQITAAAPAGPAAVRAAANRYVATRPFASASRLLVISVPGSAPISNEPDVLGLGDQFEGEPVAEQSAERRAAAAILAAPQGYSTMTLGEAEREGGLRLLAHGVHRGGRALATVRAGEPLAPVERAQEGVARTFLIAGSLTLVAALVAASALAARTAAPLRRMARTAAEVDAGELSHRISARGPHDEIRILADAFDHMLDRLEDAFARQHAFVSDASHELRTPLTVIRGQIEVLAREDDPSREDVERLREVVIAQVVRMERLVDDLLLLAQSDADHLAADRRPIELRPFLTELFDGLTLTAKRRFELDQIPDGSLVADPERLTQVIGNLFRNAIEHTVEGGLVRLAVGARGDRVEIAVIDDGPGIAAADRDRVFDRFYRTDRSRSRRSGGAGLGLAIARAMVEAHGGRIWAAEAPGGGARIAFELPGFYTGPGSARL